MMPMSPPRHNAKKVTRNRAATQQTYDRTKRTGAKFYHSVQWRRLRNWHINQHPLCVMCRESDRATIADVVDHIDEIRDGGAPLDANNLQSLCHSHHNAKTAQTRVGRVKSL